MASNPNRSRDLLDGQPMKVWMDIGRLRDNIARPMDDKAITISVASGRGRTGRSSKRKTFAM